MGIDKHPDRTTNRHRDVQREEIVAEAKRRGSPANDAPVRYGLGSNF